VIVDYRSMQARTCKSRLRLPNSNLPDSKVRSRSAMRGLAKPIFTEVYRLAKRAAEEWPLVAQSGHSQTTTSVKCGGVNRSMQHFILEGKDGVWRATGHRAMDHVKTEAALAAPVSGRMPGQCSAQIRRLPGQLARPRSLSCRSGYSVHTREIENLNRSHIS
jgi:hypothetical protein